MTTEVHRGSDRSLHLGLRQAPSTARAVRRPLGRPCPGCGSMRTWVEWRTVPEGDKRPFAVCEACGHCVAGRPRTPPEAPGEQPDDAAPKDTGSEPPGVTRSKESRTQASDERVRELLAAAGYNKAVTPEVLATHRRFATHAGKPGLPRWKAAVSVLNGAQGRNDVPDISEIYGEEKRRRATKAARAAQIRAEADALADQHADAARVHVDLVWSTTGEGPTRSELAEALGVPKSLASPVIDRLHRRGVLTSTEQPRSLAVKRNQDA